MEQNCPVFTCKKPDFDVLKRPKTKKQQTVANKSPFSGCLLPLRVFPEMVFSYYILWFIANTLRRCIGVFFLCCVLALLLGRTRSRVRISLAAPHKNARIIAICAFFLLFMHFPEYLCGRKKALNLNGSKNLQNTSLRSVASGLRHRLVQ